MSEQRVTATETCSCGASYSLTLEANRLDNTRDRINNDLTTWRRKHKHESSPVTQLVTPQQYEYVLVLDSTGEEVGIGPDENLESVMEDKRTWLRDGWKGKIKRRPISAWEDFVTESAAPGAETPT